MCAFKHSFFISVLLQMLWDVFYRTNHGRAASITRMLFLLDRGYDPEIPFTRSGIQLSCKQSAWFRTCTLRVLAPVSSSPLSSSPLCPPPPCVLLPPCPPPPYRWMMTALRFRFSGGPQRNLMRSWASSQSRTLRDPHTPEHGVGQIDRSVCDSSSVTHNCAH